MSGVAKDVTSKHNERIVWLLIAGVLVLAVLFGAAGFSSAWCASCHAMRPFAAGEASTAHESVACWRCHGADPGAFSALTAREAGDMIPRFLLTLGSGGVTGAGDGLADGGCRGCHAAIAQGTATGQGIRIRHSSCVRSDQPCTDCHAGVGHGTATRSVRVASMDGCVTCHDGTTARAGCDLCHAAKLPARRLARGPWAVTHGSKWQTTHGLGDLTTCRVCHAADYCASCHGISLPHPVSFPRTHGAVALRARKQCAKCHDEKSFCSACHGMAMPHPAGFLPAHSKIAKSLDDPLCARCHDRDTCDACHVSHTHPGLTRGTLGTVKLPAVPR